MKTSFFQSTTAKVLILFLTAIVLLVPNSMIKDLIKERQRLQAKTTENIAGKWGADQEIIAPILVIPYEVISEEEKDKEGKTSRMYIRPEIVKMDCHLSSEQLSKGLYDVNVYESEVTITGKIDLEPYAQDIQTKDIVHEEIFLSMNVKDIGGLSSILSYELNGKEQEVTTTNRDACCRSYNVNFIAQGIELTEEITYSIKLLIKGSKDFNIAPVALRNEVNMTSDFASPNFIGSNLPNERKINRSGFSASWKTNNFMNKDMHQWDMRPSLEGLSNMSFGVNLYTPITDYQKTMRSAKYAALVIFLTFLIFFISEILLQAKIHFIQYGLIGLAIVIFYALLLSLSEHIKFNIAYIASATTVILMIALYTKAILSRGKFAWISGLTLAAIYLFIFTIIQLEYYSLLIGTIGVTVILASTMYLTRNIDWYATYTEDNR